MTNKVCWRQIGICRLREQGALVSDEEIHAQVGACMEFMTLLITQKHERPVCPFEKTSKKDSHGNDPEH
jgi:hypothetical protein